MTCSIDEMMAMYSHSFQTNPAFTLGCSFFTGYSVVYILGISYYAANHFIIEWKTKMWENATDAQVIEEIKYIIRKYTECADLNTIESIIAESINLTKYSEPYRIECYRQGLKYRVKALENV